MTEPDVGSVHRLAYLLGGQLPVLIENEVAAHQACTVARFR